MSSAAIREGFPEGYWTFAMLSRVSLRVGRLHARFVSFLISGTLRSRFDEALPRLDPGTVGGITSPERRLWREHEYAWLERQLSRTLDFATLTVVASLQTKGMVMRRAFEANHTNTVDGRKVSQLPLLQF